MGGFLDRLNAMVVNTTSPTKVAKVRLHRKEGIRLDWGLQGNLSAEQRWTRWRNPVEWDSP